MSLIPIAPLSHWLTAIALITGPGEPSSAKLTSAIWQSASHIESLSIALELLDPRETKYFFREISDFWADLQLIRGRWRELKDAPRLSEADRFPGREMVNKLLAFNREMRNDLAAWLETDSIHADQLRATIAELDVLYRVWDAVRDSRCEYYYIPTRRESLQTLRDLIGREAFIRSELPPLVPMWRVPRRD